MWLEATDSVHGYSKTVRSEVLTEECKGQIKSNLSHLE